MRGRAGEGVFCKAFPEFANSILLRGREKSSENQSLLLAKREI